MLRLRLVIALLLTISLVPVAAAEPCDPEAPDFDAPTCAGVLAGEAQALADEVVDTATTAATSAVGFATTFATGAQAFAVQTATDTQAFAIQEAGELQAQVEDFDPAKAPDHAKRVAANGIDNVCRKMPNLRPYLYRAEGQRETARPLLPDEANGGIDGAWSVAGHLRATCKYYTYDIPGVLP